MCWYILGAPDPNYWAPQGANKGEYGISNKSLTFSILPYYILKYPLKCAPAETAGAHLSGYISTTNDDRTMF